MGVVTFNPFNTLITNIITSYEFSIILIFGLFYIIQELYNSNFVQNNYETLLNLFISISTGIMFPVGLILLYNIFNNYESIINIILVYSFTIYYSYFTNTLDIILLLSIIILSFTLVGYFIGSCFSFYNRCRQEKIVIIVRGVPGIGKTSYVASQELKICDNNFKVCYWQHYYGKGNKYRYRPNETKQAELWTIMQFLNYMTRRIPRIYILSSFEQKWQYDIYVYLSLIMGYKCKIIELECLNHRYLQHFQQRSTHNVPLTRSLRIFNDWQYDERSIIQDPFIEPELQGDCIPTYNTDITKETLDHELDIYHMGHYKNNNTNNYKYNSQIRSNIIIDHISNNDRTFIGL